MKWQSMQCMPFSRWMSSWCTGRPSRFDSAWSKAACWEAAALRVRYRSLSSTGICTAAIIAAVDSSWTGSPRWSSSLPCRSFLKTARKTQPWPWKSANCVCLAFGFRSATRSRNAGSDQFPRAAASSGFDIIERVNSSAVGCFCFGGYISSPSVSSSHHMKPV